MACRSAGLCNELRPLHKRRRIHWRRATLSTHSTRCCYWATTSLINLFLIILALANNNTNSMLGCMQQKLIYHAEAPRWAPIMKRGNDSLSRGLSIVFKKTYANNYKRLLFWPQAVFLQEKSALKEEIENKIYCYLLARQNKVSADAICYTVRSTSSVKEEPPRMFPKNHNKLNTVF